MTESVPRKIGYWESMGKIVMSDPMKDTIEKVNKDFQSFCVGMDLSQKEAAHLSAQLTAVSIDFASFHGITDDLPKEFGHFATKQEFDELAATTGNTSYEQDGAEDLLERISKAVPEIMECLESGRVDRAGLKLEEVKLDLDDYNEGDVS